MMVGLDGHLWSFAGGPRGRVGASRSHRLRGRLASPSARAPRRRCSLDSWTRPGLIRLPARRCRRSRRPRPRVGPPPAEPSSATGSASPASRAEQERNVTRATESRRPRRGGPPDGAHQSHTPHARNGPLGLAPASRPSQGRAIELGDHGELGCKPRGEIGDAPLPGAASARPAQSPVGRSRCWSALQDGFGTSCTIVPIGASGRSGSSGNARLST